MKKFMKALVVSLGLIVASCHGVPAHAQSNDAKAFCHSYASGVGVYHAAMQQGFMTLEDVKQDIMAIPATNRTEVALQKMYISAVEFAYFFRGKSTDYVKSEVYLACLNSRK